MRLADVSQQDLYLQHPIAHAFSVGAFERMHVAAGSRTAPRKSAVARTTEVLILPSITLLYSTIRAERRPVEPRPLQIARTYFDSPPTPSGLAPAFSLKAWVNSCRLETIWGALVRTVLASFSA